MTSHRESTIQALPQDVPDIGPAEMNVARPSLALVALAMMAFGMGTTETIVTGLLTDIARDLISPEMTAAALQAAGWLVSAYALGVAVAAPLLTVLTLGFPRRGILIVASATFTIVHVMSALSHDYWLLLATRIMAAGVHGVAAGIALVTAAELVADDRRGWAIGVMLSGFTVANILGVPLGTFLGSALGDWRSAFWAIAGWGAVATFALFVLLPPMPVRRGASLTREIGAFTNPLLLLALLVLALAFGSSFVAFTYIKAILENVTHMAPTTVTLALLLFGLGMTVGNMIGSRTSDRWPLHTIFASLSLLVTILLAFTVTAHHAVAALVTIFLWGIGSYAFMPAVLLRVFQQALSAPRLASAMNVAICNAGISGGALLGGYVAASPWGLMATPGVAALVALLCMGVVTLSVGLETSRPLG
ncbi:MAG: MFS transporter [Pseudomonadota bacterium]|jgi:DHA1 family inner membrane transport protein